MKDNNFLKKIKKLDQIQPSKDWLFSTRQSLEAQIDFDQATNPRHDGIRFLNWLKQPQTTALALCLTVMILGGPWLLVQASQASLPGEWLYSIKKANEGIQVKIASDYNRGQLQVEFANRRVEELIKIARDSVSDHEKSAKAQEVIDSLKNNLAQVSVYTNQLSKEEALSVAEQTKQIRQDLDRTEQNTPEQLQDELAEAKKAADRINQEILTSLANTEEDQQNGQNSENATTTDEEVMIILEETKDGDVTTTDKIINGEKE